MARQVCVAGRGRGQLQPGVRVAGRYRQAGKMQPTVTASSPPSVGKGQGAGKVAWQGGKGAGRQATTPTNWHRQGGAGRQVAGARGKALYMGQGQSLLRQQQGISKGTQQTGPGSKSRQQAAAARQVCSKEPHLAGKAEGRQQGMGKARARGWAGRQAQQLGVSKGQELQRQPPPHCIRRHTVCKPSKGWQGEGQRHLGRRGEARGQWQAVGQRQGKAC